MIHISVFFFVTSVLQTFINAQTSYTLLRYRQNDTLNATVHLKNIPTNIDRYEISYNTTGQGINCKILYSFLTCEANNDIERPRDFIHFWNQNVENLKIPGVVAEKTKFLMEVFSFDVNTTISSRIISQANGIRDYDITTEPYTIFVPNHEIKPFNTEKIYYSQSDRKLFRCNTNNRMYKNVQIGLVWPGQNRLQMLQAQETSTDKFPNGMILFCVAYTITTDDKQTTVQRHVSQNTMLVHIIKPNEKKIENNNNSPNMPNAPNYSNHVDLSNYNNHNNYPNSAEISPAPPPQPDNNDYYTHSGYNAGYPSNNNLNTKKNPTPNYPKQTPRTIPYLIPPETSYTTPPVTLYPALPMTTKPIISTNTSTTTTTTTSTTTKPTTTTTPKPTTTTTTKPTTTTTTKPTTRRTTKPTTRRTTKPTTRRTTKPTTRRTTKPTTRRTTKSTSYFTVTPISNTANKTNAHTTTEFEISNAKMTVDKPTYNQPSTMENDSLSPFTNKTKYYLATGSVGIIIIVALIVYVVCKKRHKKSPEQETVQELELETYATSALLYADLRLDPAKNTRQVKQNEETYAQIVGVLKPRESHGQKY
ncbi:mucin-5AC-like [Helicoverpa zea]|uniref:mucin-5AC-like n=1 Tax=Helicoverpa zea TaxID=7113 RepID=UPI001F572FA2|nr:mucin-5AC-like [Helicoverpa zea]